MKTLLLLRHAHPTPSSAGEQDIERHIDDVGTRQVSHIAGKIKEKNLTIDHVISSPAVRALETADLICRELNIDHQLIEIDKRIYTNTLDELLRVIHEINDEFKNVMLIGHNPGFSQLAAYLTGDSSIRLSTCGTCFLASNRESWDDLNFHGADCGFIESPPKE